MNYLKMLVVMLLAFVLSMFFAVPAIAGGSNDPTPYTVDTAGITLPDGDVFKANGHVNIKYLVDGKKKSVGIHIDPNNNQPGGHWVGHNFIPWSAFGVDIDCVTWVQINDYNEHWGEASGHGAPLCLKKPDTAPPSDSEERVRDTGFSCEERVVYWVKEKREAIFDYDWNEDKWVQTGWKDWVEVDSGFRNEKPEQCGDIPVVGSELNMALLLAAMLLIGTGGYVLTRESQK